MSELQKFTSALEAWYANNKRDFPWRETEDPYRIWVAEIMSHQTQIQRVAEKFYPRFIEKFPDLSSLASSNWEEVYPVWEGLGYYNRGKNLLKTAQIVQKDFEGLLPKDLYNLQSLPGVGSYTAAAILSFAWDEKVPAVDTNISKIIKILWPRKDIIKTSELLIESAQSGRNWNSAMMDLATKLRAGEAIEGDLAQFFPEAVAEKFKPQRNNKSPKKKNAKKKSQKLIEVGIACIWQDGKYLIQSRPEGKSFVGRWEFPGGKREAGESFRDCVKRELKEEIDVSVSVRPHFYEETCNFGKTKLQLRFHRCQIQAGEPKPMEKQEIKWIKPEDFFNENFLTTNRKALLKLQKMRV